MAPSEAGSQERMLSAKVGKPPDLGRENAEGRAFGERGAVREHQLHLVFQVAWTDEALVGSQRVRRRGDRHHGHVQQLFRIKQLRHGGHRTTDAKPASLLQYRLNDRAQGLHVEPQRGVREFFSEGSNGVGQ
ncbi:hypothetical protein D3C71_1749630 [compost metagenome]